MMNARESAFLSLQKHENSGAYSNIELAYAIERGGLEGAEKALYTALFYGVIERKLTLDYYISLLSDRKDIDANVRIILRIGLYQLIYMTKVPESAAVNESVKLARRFYARKNSENFINIQLFLFHQLQSYYLQNQYHQFYSFYDLYHTLINMLIVLHQLNH